MFIFLSRTNLVLVIVSKNNTIHSHIVPAGAEWVIMYIRRSQHWMHCYAGVGRYLPTIFPK